MNPLYIYIIVLLVMSSITLLLYALDKNYAKRNKWRIKEKTLLVCSILGGAIGGIIALYWIRHKNKHWYFVVVNWIGLVLQITLGVILAINF